MRSGPAAGGTAVTLSGRGFTNATAVRFGTVPAASYTVVSDAQITAVAPASTPHIPNISVTPTVGVSCACARRFPGQSVRPARSRIPGPRLSDSGIGSAVVEKGR